MIAGGKLGILAISNIVMKPAVQHFLHRPTDTFAYVVWDEATRQAAIIDPVLDYDHASGRTSTRFADDLLGFVRHQGLEVSWILETHAHADHLSAAHYLRQTTGSKIGVGAGIEDVQATFDPLFGVRSGSGHFDRLWRDGERFSLGSMDVTVLNTPGHTSDSVSYLVGDAVFVGDTLFAPDLGTARADFPGGCAATLFRSVQRLLALPADTRVFLCHDYPGTDDGRKHEHVHSVATHRKSNVHVGAASLTGEDTEASFVAMRTARDQTLATPRLMIPAVQVNLRAGELPEPESNGIAYLKVPLNTLGSS